jgi:hypothetical protein
MEHPRNSHWKDITKEPQKNLCHGLLPTTDFACSLLRTGKCLSQDKSSAVYLCFGSVSYNELLLLLVYTAWWVEYDHRLSLFGALYQYSSQVKYGTIVTKENIFLRIVTDSCRIILSSLSGVDVSDFNCTNPKNWGRSILHKVGTNWLTNAGPYSRRL